MNGLNYKTTPEELSQLNAVMNLIKIRKTSFFNLKHEEFKINYAE